MLPALLVLLSVQPNHLPANLPPEIYAWFWTADEFAPGGAERFLDRVVSTSNYGLLTTSLRVPSRQITDPDVHQHVKQAVLAAHQRGLRVAFDLDPRLARKAFQKAHPGQLQWMLRVRKVSNSGGEIAIPSVPLEDHMTGGGGEYERLSGKLLGVWSASPQGLSRITDGLLITEESATRVSLRAPAVPGSLVIAVAFEYCTPDAYAPSLSEFQEAIFRQWSDVPLDGAMKDEWGFPPTRGNGARDGDFWYSSALASAYRAAGGSEFVEDAILMATGLGGDRPQRLDAINRYMRLILEKNAAIEQQFYAITKRTFGPDAFTGTHATWGNYPAGDIFKNGLDWWQATRDYGQTDEGWPLPIRTSLAKKMGRPVWYNQYYNAEPAPYFSELWRNASAGGRVNVHPLYPRDVGHVDQGAFLSDPAFRRAQSRVRLLNYFAAAPIDCPVAVVFGHAAALNWVTPHFADLGLDVAEDLRRLGYLADIIPSSEIANGSLRIEENQVRYGAQRYRALIFLNPMFEPDATMRFLTEAAHSSTHIWLRGSQLDSVREFHSAAQVATVLQGFYKPHDVPATLSRLTDGSCVLISGAQNREGDPMRQRFHCGRWPVEFEATGVFAIRLTSRGEIDRLAASELKSLTVNGTEYPIARPVDLAVWHDAAGVWQGVIQGSEQPSGPIGAWVRHWQRIEPNPTPR